MTFSRQQSGKEYNNVIVLLSEFLLLTITTRLKLLPTEDQLTSESLRLMTKNPPTPCPHKKSYNLQHLKTSLQKSKKDIYT